MSDNLHGQPPMPPPFQAIKPSSPLKAIAAVHPIPVAAGADVVAVGWRAHAAAQPRVLGHLRMAGMTGIKVDVHNCGMPAVRSPHDRTNSHGTCAAQCIAATTVTQRHTLRHAAPHLLRDDEAALLHAVGVPLRQRGRRRQLGDGRLDQPRLQ